jgi:uncharacterized protein
MKRKFIVIFASGFLLSFFISIWLTGGILCAPANHRVGDLPSGLAGIAVQFQSASGAMIHGWFMPGMKGAGAIILMHGVRSDRRSMLNRAKFLSHSGYSVLLFDFQSHGESRGNHITFGYLESMDAQAAFNFVRVNAPDEKIGVIGISMGGAAILLASPPLNADAIVLEMVYPTITRAITNRLTMRLGSWAEILTPLLSWQLKPRLGIYAEDLCPINKVGKIITPKLFIFGDEDQHTTPEESLKIFHAAAEPKEFWMIKGARHVDLYGKEYEHRVSDFFEKNLR